jgi:hypothetical protein
MKEDAMMAKPWYREPWPWILMSGPAIVVVAGIVTAALAVSSFDGMVADDYYKQGLGINRLMARGTNAKALGIAGSVQFNPDRNRVRVVLEGTLGPGALRMTLAHPTLPAEDQSIALANVSPGVYEGTMRPPRGRVLHLALEDVSGKWRLAADWKTRADGVRLEAN